MRFLSLGVLLALGLAGCGDSHVGTRSQRDTAVAVDSLPALLDARTFPDAVSPPQDTNELPLDLAGPLDTGATDSGAGAEVESPADAGTGHEVAPAPPVSLVILPDTQYYSAGYPTVYVQQTSWILAQKTALNIAAVLHVGDVVDTFNDTNQWSNATAAMRALDGMLPYVMVPGNHDLDTNNKDVSARRQGIMNNYFGPASMPWITGTMTADQIENNYTLLDIGPQKWLVLGIEFGPRDAVLAWADGVLKDHATVPAVIVTHAYLYGDGNRYDINLSSVNHQSFIPQDYGVTPSQGINDGEMMWQKLILPNSNVRMVFCGHDSGAARLTSSRPDGSRVHQMLSDYQWWGDGAPSFGFGWLRVVQLDYGKQTISVQTYSPYLGQYLTDDANQFALEWNL
jgi:hypothetical protein